MLHRHKSMGIKFSRFVGQTKVAIHSVSKFPVIGTWHDDKRSGSKTRWAFGQRVSDMQPIMAQWQTQARMMSMSELHSYSFRKTWSSRNSTFLAQIRVSFSLSSLARSTPLLCWLRLTLYNVRRFARKNFFTIAQGLRAVMLSATCMSFCSWHTPGAFKIVLRVK